ncbi:HlyD family secretion protein [Candidatus Latescibacterota bacterium]
MHLKKHIPRLILFGAIAVAAYVVFFYSGTFPFRIEVVGKILPWRDMTVSAGDDGIISVMVHDNLNGTRESRFLTELERGDVVMWRLHHAVVPGATIDEGDTVCRIYSSEIERELVNLRGELDIRKAALKLVETGEKESVIEEARHFVASAHEQLNEQENITVRQKALFEAGFVPYQDYELAASQLELFRIEVEKAEAQLATVMTGVKREERDYIIAAIAGLEHDIDALAEKRGHLTITAPFSGKVFDQYADSSATVTIGDMSRLCVMLLVELKHIQYIRRNQTVEIRVDGIDETLRGTLTSVGTVSRMVLDNQVTVAIAVLDSPGRELPAGAIADCRIHVEPVTVREYLRRTITTIL